jgi:DNA-directed RNA polymerase II subunit RPB1
VQIYFDPDDGNTQIADDVEMMEQYYEFENMVDECSADNTNVDNRAKSKWLIRMEMNDENMFEKNITMDDINFALKNSYGDDVHCVYNDYNANKLVFRIRMNNIIKKNKKNDGVPQTLDQSDEIYLLKNFQETLLNNIDLRGVSKIKKVIMRKILDEVVKNEDKYVKEENWVLDTVGSNLIDLLALDFIDYTKTTSTHIIEVYNVLGIEAARQTIYNEIVEVMENSYINYHHLTLLCDRMTYSTKMISIFRHGINGDDIGPLAKASFEETPEMFLKAARHGELDHMRGVSANVMCGQEGNFGTSSFQVILDLDKMKKLEEEEYIPENKTEYIENMFKNIDKQKTKCNDSTLKIDSNINTSNITESIDDDYMPDL